MSRLELDRDKYIYIMDKISSKKYGVQFVYILGKVITYFTAVIYTGIIIMLMLKFDIRFIRITLVPAAAFIILSVFRTKYNAVRPYEKYGFKPLIPKDTKGRSFPSRHVFSIFMCGSAAGYIYPVLGAVIYLMGIVLAVIRVITGVHFPKDVIAGALIGILCGIAGFNM